MSPVTKSSKNNVYAKAQALIRGYLARKSYKKLVKKKLHRVSVVNEIFKTEQSYVKSLEVMIEIYLVPLRDDPKKYGITKEEVNIIFANIETIANLHKEMLKVLEQRIQGWSNTQKIGDIFINFAPFLKMLNGYCSNYDAAITTLTQARQDKKIFAAFLEKCEATESVHILPAYLIQPIQRVPRYNLLLEELIRSTWEWHNDYETLCNSLRAMKLIADHINESLHKSEKANKVVKIQSDLGGECALLEPHRRWIKDGPLIRVKRFNDLIVFAGRILISYRFIEKYPLDSTTIMDLPNEKFQIASVAAQSAYILAAETEEIKNEWMTAIATAKNNYNEGRDKVEQRKTLERETSQTVERETSQTHLSAPLQPTISSHTPAPSHVSLPIQAQQFQSQLALRLQQRNQSPLAAPAPSHPTPSHPTQPASLSQSPPHSAVRPSPHRPPAPSTLMKFDFASMPITEGGEEEEEEMTFAERRLMFERGLLPQIQAVTPRRPPVARESAKYNLHPPKTLGNKANHTTLQPAVIRELIEQGKKRKNTTPNQSAHASVLSPILSQDPLVPPLQPSTSLIANDHYISQSNTNTLSGEKRQADYPSPRSTSPSGHTTKVMQPQKRTTQTLPSEIPQGIVGERKYSDPNHKNEMNAPLLGKNDPKAKTEKKESNCCVIL